MVFGVFGHLRLRIVDFVFVHSISPVDARCGVFPHLIWSRHGPHGKIAAALISTCDCASNPSGANVLGFVADFVLDEPSTSINMRWMLNKYGKNHLVEKWLSFLVDKSRQLAPFEVACLIVHACCQFIAIKPFCRFTCEIFSVRFGLLRKSHSMHQFVNATVATRATPEPNITVNLANYICRSLGQTHLESDP